MTIGKDDTPKPQKTIVLVDDDPLIVEALTDLLSAEGYTVHTARDGLDALSVIWEVEPDYIILDAVLPKLDGGQICAAVRQDARLRKTPIIAFSALSPQDYQFFPQLSADAYVAKGRLAVSAHHILTVINQFEGSGTEQAKAQLLGYEQYQSRRLVNELLRERRYLMAILRVVAPGALVLDRDGRIVMANPGSCEILGKLETELVGELLAALAPPDHRHEVQSLLTTLGQSEEERHLVTAFHLGAEVMAVRLATIVEDRACTGLLLLLDRTGGQGVRI
jgi:PAS domain S-box-containing protein